MNTMLEDFSSWSTEELVTVPPETLECSDLVGLVIELQNRIQDSYWQWPIQLKD